MKGIEYRAAVANGSRKPPPSERPLLPQGHASLEELLASSVVRHMMKRDGVDASDVRKLIASIADASHRRHLVQEHRAELAGADQPDPYRPPRGRGFQSRALESV